jgi:hypothetical protein
MLTMNESVTVGDRSADDIMQQLPGESVNEVTSDEYRRITGESLSQTVDLALWKKGVEALKDYDRLEAEVTAAEEISAEVRKAIRERIFPAIPEAEGAPKEAGVWRLTPEDLVRTHRDVLMNGLVEGCDGNVHVVNTMALQIVQIAVVGVSYNAEEESWAHRIFKRDIRVHPGADMVEETLKLLKRRSPDEDSRDKPRHDAPRCHDIHGAPSNGRRPPVALAIRSRQPAGLRATHRCRQRRVNPLERPGSTTPDRSPEIRLRTQ